MRFSMISLGALALATAAPAWAQDTAEPEATPAITVTGGIGGVTDYRFRGLTQSDQKPAANATVNINHESGLYVGTWASTIDDDVSLPGYGDVEIDLYGGFTKTLPNGLGFDIGMLYYYYADAPNKIAGLKNDTDFFEPYASVNYTFGPANVKIGGNYAFKGQDGLGGDDSLYVYTNVGVGIAKTPLKVLAHVGMSDGTLGAFNLNPTDDSYFDYSLGIEASFPHATIGVQYVDTDITSRYVPLLGEKFNSAIGAQGVLVGYATFTF